MSEPAAFTLAGVHASHDLGSAPFGLYSASRTVWCRRCQVSALFDAGDRLIPWSGDDGHAFAKPCGCETAEHQLARLMAADPMPSLPEETTR